MKSNEYRAWDKNKKEMLSSIELRCFQLIDLQDNPRYIFIQYSGLKDKNGIKIFEGDIVKNEREEVGKIVFSNGCFVSEYLPPYNWDAMQPCDGFLERQEVIGNIYKNKDLINNK